MIVETEKVTCACGNNEPIEWCGEYCQMCWEKECSRTWWEMVRNINLIAETTQNDNSTTERKVIGTYEKSEIDRATKFAKVYSKTFPQNRVCIENFSDSHGITVWNHSNQNACGSVVVIFQKGINKRK